MMAGPLNLIAELYDNLFSFVEIPTGPFQMGSADDDPEAEDNEKPQHTVEVRQLHKQSYFWRDTHACGRF
jgi:formylglycine-generating enzyme required for sulfatase activity